MKDVHILSGGIGDYFIVAPIIDYILNITRLRKKDYQFVTDNIHIGRLATYFNHEISYQNKKNLYFMSQGGNPNILQRQIDFFCFPDSPNYKKFKETAFFILV